MQGNQNGDLKTHSNILEKRTATLPTSLGLFIKLVTVVLTKTLFGEGSICRQYLGHCSEQLSKCKSGSIYRCIIQISAAS